MITLPAKILVVDDEKLVEDLFLQHFRKKIRAKHYQFFFARDVSSALEKLQEREIDIILTDINMPETSGLTLVKEVKQTLTSIKVIVISAYGSKENVEAAMNLGAETFIPKPIDFNKLSTAIDNSLE